MWVDKVPQTPLHHHWLPQIQIQCSANTNTVQHICKYKYVTAIDFDEDSLASPMPFHIGEVLIICAEKMILEAKKMKNPAAVCGGPAKITVIKKQKRNTHEPYKICNKCAM